MFGVDKELSTFWQRLSTLFSEGELDFVNSVEGTYRLPGHAYLSGLEQNTWFMSRTRWQNIANFFVKYQ